MINKFFVYGTLQRGMSNESFISDKAISWCKPAQVKGSLYWVNRGNYPAMIFEKEKHIIHGELIEIKDEFLKKTTENCDHLEGHPSFYKRITIEVTDNDGKNHTAYAYEFLHYNMLGEKIPSGNFKDAFGNKFISRTVR